MAWVIDSHVSSPVKKKYEDSWVLPPFLSSKTGKLLAVSENTVDSNSKDFVVGTDGVGDAVNLLMARVSWVTTSTPGTRELRFSMIGNSGTYIIDDPPDTLVFVPQDTTVSQSVYFTRAPGVENATQGDTLSACAPIFALNGQTIRISDGANVDSNDDMLVSLVLEIL